MKKEWWYVVALVVLILVLMIIFRDDVGLGPKSSGKLKNTDGQNELNYLGGKLIKNPSSQEAKSLFSKFIASRNG